jgi:hypothetical protein
VRFPEFTYSAANKPAATQERIVTTSAKSGGITANILEIGRELIPVY